MSSDSVCAPDMLNRFQHGPRDSNLAAFEHLEPRCARQVRRREAAAASLDECS